MNTHIVLVPGFGGFDALGQVEYYSGVTGVFKTCLGGKPAVLHYFDNLPTAAVVTRAARLRSWLAKRIARGEIHEKDKVILAGHSTGGLDIRQLIWDLHCADGSQVLVDGEVPVSYKEIREHICRVVFLSVPQWGTYVADWVQSHPWLRQLVVTKLRAAVCASQLFVLDEIEERAAAAAAFLTDADLLRAVRDALREANECYGDSQETAPQRTADAHEAASQLALYVRHMASDFHVIHDLATHRPRGGPASPAHFNGRERKQEIACWNDVAHPIEALSYATLGNRPFPFHSGHPAPVWDLTNPCSYPEIAKDHRMSAGTDIPYRACYRACAGGTFEWPGLTVTKRIGQIPHEPLDLWDNDGIVNTRSMQWPKGEIVLVGGDHLDIVGHFHRVRNGDGRSPRKYRSYDTLRSASQFTSSMFDQIWEEIFAFAMGGRPLTPNPNP